jgi:hypothetical protein
MDRRSFDIRDSRSYIDVDEMIPYGHSCYLLANELEKKMVVMVANRLIRVLVPSFLPATGLSNFFRVREPRVVNENYLVVVPGLLYELHGMNPEVVKQQTPD